MTTSDNAAPKPSMLDTLTSLRDRADQQLVDLAAVQAEISTLVELPEAGAVTAEFDERGLLRTLAIDPARRVGLDGSSLERDMNIAFSRAERPSLHAPTDQTPESADAVSALVATVFQAVLSGVLAEPVSFTNDLSTVTVTSMWGELVSVQISPHWVSASRDASISEEVLRVVNLALLQDDPLGRRKA
jgi:hypothetical protein